MGRPRTRFHTPGKRRRGNSWHVFWRTERGVCEVSVGAISESGAEERRLEIALALRTGAWPDWALRRPAVQRQLKRRPIAGDDLVGDYARELGAVVSAGWARSSLAVLRELQAVTGRSLAEVSPADAEAFLAHVSRTPGPFLKRRPARTRGTRNRTRMICRRFYSWAVRTERVRLDPFAETRSLPEGDALEILHLSREERDRVLEAAAGDPDGLAVWLALYAGLRRGEVARCRWADLHLGRRKLDVPRTKTMRRRVVDLAAPLRTVPERRRLGRVVPWPAGDGAWRYAATQLLERLAAKLSDMPAGKLRWNVFRHTFASSLVQAGVSIWKVSRWMGNSVAICTRHYASMSPDYDADIDRIG